MKTTSLLCLILLGLSCVASADVSPFYKVNTKVKGTKTNERRLGDILGSVEQDSVKASILNSRELNVGHRDVIIGSKGKPHLGIRGTGKGKGGFKYKNRSSSSSSSSSSKSSKKSSKKGKGGKGKGGKGEVGIIHNPIPTHPVTPPVASPIMPPVNPISNDAISGDTTNDAISGDTPSNPAVSISRDGSGDDPASADTPPIGNMPDDSPSVDDPNDPATSDSSSADDASPSQVFNFIMESTEVNSLDAQENFQLTTVLTLNGDLFDIIEENGAPTRGPQNLGDFRGVCTITGIEHYLCNYELYFRTTGDVGAGGIIIKGPVFGTTSVAVVTGTSFDYAIYDTGSVTLTQDPNERWLIVRTDIFSRTSS